MWKLYSQNIKKNKSNMLNLKKRTGGIMEGDKRHQKLMWNKNIPKIFKRMKDLNSFQNKLLQ